MRDQKQDWVTAYADEKEKNGVTFPSEYVIRMFKGTYPKCNLKIYGGGYNGKSILDVSCGGAARDLIVLDQVGFSSIAATEIASEIVDEAKQNVEHLGIKADIRVGTNRNLPFATGEFDYLLSWNVCYYFDEVMDFEQHVNEYARVLKPGAVMVFSIPKPKCFIYKDGINRGNGLIEITNDPFGVRNGIILRCFKNENDIAETFGTHFEDFTFGSIEDDCFGLNYSWYIGYCRKKQ